MLGGPGQAPSFYFRHTLPHIPYISCTGNEMKRAHAAGKSSPDTMHASSGSMRSEQTATERLQQARSSRKQRAAIVRKRNVCCSLRTKASPAVPECDGVHVDGCVELRAKGQMQAVE